jgi:ABC-type Na+ efflux pump permease subunit
MSTVMPPPTPASAAQPDRPLSAKEAKAEAKAAKARAKALRPWYRKKRYILTILLVVIIGIVAATSGGGDKSTTDTAATVAGVDNGIGSANASADVTNAVLGEPDAIGFRTVTMNVTNNSSKRSNYLIDLSIESADGTTQYDTTVALVNNLEPGQTTSADALSTTKDIPVGAIVTIKTVSRTASN